MKNTTSNTRAGRPAMEGKTRRYIVADDVHEWILQHGAASISQIPCAPLWRCSRTTSSKTVVICSELTTFAVESPTCCHNSEINLVL